MQNEHEPCPPVFTAGLALELQDYLGRRLMESKTQPSAGEIQEEMVDLCDEVLKYLQGWVMVGKRAVFGEGCMLYWVERYWRDLEPLHGHYESFHDFALQETGEDYSTFRMKIAVYRTFILNEERHPKIAELGSDTFLDVPVGKLQKAIGAIRRGDITDTQWDALIDPNVNDRHFHHIMKAKPLPNGSGEESEEEDFTQHGGGPRKTVQMDTGSLTYWPGGDQLGIPIGWLDVGTQSELIREAVDAVIEAAEIERVH